MGVARDRLVENYFGVVGWAYEPKFWRSREAMTKANCFITYIDDIYDVYGSLEELELFTEVVDRWDATAIEQLPNYMKICFMALFNTTNDTAYKTLKLKGVNPLLYLKKAVAGIAEVGRDHYGVFPLKGKLLNVQEASHKQIMENAEIQNIKQILGLQHGKQYDSVKGLRYGHLMIMTDQDHDGSHIKGLLINFIHSFWPSLLKIKGFMVEFITPIVKATHRSGKVLAFYTIPEYEAWKESFSGHASGWSIKYYKGLGTSTEVKESMMESMVKFPHDLEPCVMPQPFSANELKVFLKRKADSITKVQI